MIFWHKQQEDLGKREPHKNGIYLNEKVILLPKAQSKDESKNLPDDFFQKRDRRKNEKNESSIISEFENELKIIQEKEEVTHKKAEATSSNDITKRVIYQIGSNEADRLKERLNKIKNKRKNK